jgi:hypothetical protein
MSTHAFAEASDRGENLVKAAFLYNFAKFVEWPDDVFPDAQAPFVLCVLGEDPFGSALEIMEQKTIKDRKFLIKRTENIEELKKCHMLFVSRSESKYLNRILTQLKDSNILTVSDIEDFAERGGMIGLLKIKKKIRFEIAVNNAKQHGLKISSKLLNLAKIVD